MNDWEYETELAKLKKDYVFVLEHAIRNDDSAKDRLAKINALAYRRLGSGYNMPKCVLLVHMSIYTDLPSCKGQKETTFNKSESGV